MKNFYQGTLFIFLFLLVGFFSNCGTKNQNTKTENPTAQISLPLQKGDKVPKLILSNPQNQEQNLEKILEKHSLILIDFWASWCPPCREENPNLVKFYQKYKDKGFAIVSVSLDTDKDKWLKAIEKDGLTWKYHLSDLKGWDSQAGLDYGIDGVPMSFLVNKNAEILELNLRGEALEKAIQENLK